MNEARSEKAERFIMKNKAAFKKRYGADWERVLYATANKQFKEEHGAGEWGTNKLTDKYKNDTPGQEDAKVRTKKVVLKKRINEATPPSGPKNPDKPYVGKTAHEKKVERYQQYLAKKKRDREQHLRNNPGLTQNRRRPVSQNAFYSKRAFRNQEINASYDPDVEQVDESSYKVSVEGIGTIIVDGSGEAEVKMKLRKLVKKPDMIGDIERVTPSKKRKHFMMKAKGEEEEIEEARGSDYKLYHKSYTDAVKHAFAHHAKSGLRSSDDDKMHHIGLNSKKPGEGKTTSVSVPATHKSGKKHQIHIQVYNKGGSHPYELNTYSSTHRSMQEAKGDSTSATIKVSGGDAVEIGMVKRGGRIQYYWKAKSGLKNVFDSPEKLRYSLRNTANFSGAEKAVAQLQKLYPVNESKSEYNKLMDKYGDMPMSKVPMKARLRIRELGRSVRGDKGGPTAGDLVKSMKRRRMGEEVEQVDENRAQSMTNRALDKVSREKSSRSDDEFEVKYAKSKRGPIQVSKFGTLNAAKGFLAAVEKKGMKGIISKDGKPVREEVEQVDEAKYGGLLHKIRKGGKPGGLRDKLDQRGVGLDTMLLHPDKMRKSKVGRAQRMADRRPSLKGTGPIDDPDNYALKSAGADKAGLYFSKSDKSGAAKLFRQISKERSAKIKNSRNYKRLFPNEEVEVAEAGMIGRTKPSRELNVQKFEKKYLGTKSLKDAKRAAHKAERKKGKADVKINPAVDENVDAAKERVAQAKQRVMVAKQRLARTKARDYGNKVRGMRSEGMTGNQLVRNVSSKNYQASVSSTKHRYDANRQKRKAAASQQHADVLRRRAIARARSKRRVIRRPM